MKKSLFLLCALICMSIFTGCTNSVPDLFCTIYGSVTDKSSGEPIDNASIMLTPGGKTTVSGSDGSFQFDNLESHQYTIQVQKDGYKTDRKSVNAIVGESVKVDFSLTK